jgi:hypothetical protein
MNTPMDFFKIAQQTQEAYCVRHGIPVERKFSDDELVDSHMHIAGAERELSGDMSTDERLGRLSTDEQRLLDALDTRPLIPFRVTTSLAGQPAEQISILARTSCDAAIQAVQLLFLDAGDCITTGFKVKGEPIRAMTCPSQEAA